MSWTTRQLLIGLSEIGFAVLVLALLVVSPPVAFALMVPVAVVSLGVTPVAGVLAVLFVFMALLR